MKQYQIAFYQNRKTASPTIYYREFDSVKELKAWANDVMGGDSLYVRYTYLKIPLYQFLENT